MPAKTEDICRLEAAIVLNTGVHSYTREGWITILPLGRLWA
jgi:hypothetical protein